MNCITPNKVNEAITLEDLSAKEGHALNLIVKLISKNLKERYNIEPDLQKGKPIVSLSDNYEKLGYPNTEVTLGSRYTRYVTDTTILRTQMTSTIPSLLENFSKNPEESKLWVCPGLVFRRDVVDRTHVGEPHQMDIWYVTKKEKMTRQHLLELVEVVVQSMSQALKQKIEYRYNETSHFYTEGGIEVEINYQGRWLEILECGLAGSDLLRNSGLDPGVYSGLALGMGLDRAAMIIKNIDDIRVLRDKDSRIQKQMMTLETYKSVSRLPSIKRDLSIAVGDHKILEDVTESIMDILQEKNEAIEEINLVSETHFDNLPQVARDKLGMSATQKNMLIRITLRHVSKTLTSEEANGYYVDIYDKINEGACGYKLV